MVPSKDMGEILSYLASIILIWRNGFEMIVSEGPDPGPDPGPDLNPDITRTDVW